MFPERLERDDVQGSGVRGGQDNGRRSAGFIGLQPPGRNHTPSVPRAQARKMVFWPRCCEIIPDLSLVLQELGCHNRTYSVTTKIFRTSAAAAVAEETCHGVATTGLQFSAEYVSFVRHCHRLPSPRPSVIDSVGTDDLRCP